MQLRCLVVIIGLVAACSSAQAVGSAAVPSPSFTVSLDDPPASRWQHVVEPFLEVFPAIDKWIDSLMPSSDLEAILVAVMGDLGKYLPWEYPQELQGIADAANMDLGKIVAMNLIYDFTAYCTSIVANYNNGTILHSRNLDYDVPFLRNITVDVHFTKAGKVVHHCTTFAGYAGCLTGMSPGVFSVSVDERDVANQTIFDNLVAMLEGGQSLGFLIRSTLMNASSFDEALSTFANTRLIAPVYIIMAGTKSEEGVVITRDRFDARDIWRIDLSVNRWWLVETNYDHWLPPPSGDDRRDPANKGMEALGRDNLSLSGVYNVLTIQPVLNSGTKYTAQMIPGTGHFQSYIRWDSPPNVPFYSQSVFSKKKHKQD